MTTATTKPRLRRCESQWLCVGGAEFGVADTPFDAYVNWMKHRVQAEINARLNKYFHKRIMGTAIG